MKKYTLDQQAAISDIIFNYPADFEEKKDLLRMLGFDLTIAEIEQEYNERL